MMVMDSLRSAPHTNVLIGASINTTVNKKTRENAL